jgi:hypothetical protein
VAWPAHHNPKPALLLTAAIIAFSLGALLSSAARADGAEWCPKAGTVIKKTWTSSGEYTTVHLGPDPADPTVCRMLRAGKMERDLLNFVALDNHIYAPGSLERWRAGLSAILTGEKHEASFDVTSMAQGAVRGWSGTTITLVREGNEELLIGDQSINTVKLKLSYKGMANNGYRYDRDIWYDPKTHLFVKEQVIVYNIGTRGTPEGYVTTSISIP